MKLHAADYAIISLVIMAFAILVMMTVMTPYPNMRDAWFHILVARAWHKGLNGMISQVVMDINKIPYAPMYHVMISPFVGTVDSAITIQKVLQCIFYPVGLLFSMLLVRKQKNSMTAFLFGALLTGTYYAFGMMQARPQSFAVMLFPVALWATLNKKSLVFFISVVSMFYLYSPISIALSCGLILYRLSNNWKDPLVWGALLFSAFIPIYQATYLFDPAIFQRWVSSGDLGIYAETMKFLADPAFWLLNGLGLSIAGFMLIPLNILRWSRLGELDKMMLYSYVGFFILLPVWYMRVFHFAIIPMAYFTASFISDDFPKPLKYFMIAVIILQAIWFTMTPVFWMSRPPYLEQYW